MTLDTAIADLEAVFAALELETAALFADLMAGPAAIAFAATQPDRITHLILYGTFASPGAVMTGGQIGALANLCRTDWDSAARLFADQGVRELFPEEGLKFTEIFRQSASGENAARLLSVRTDVSELLPLVKCPTLVMHRRDDPSIPFSAGQELAATLPNAEFLPLDGSVHAYFLGDHEPMLSAVDSFLGREELPASKAAAPATAADMYTILFTDMASSTTLADQLGDAAAQEVRRVHNEIVRAALTANSGNEIKHTGDGIMASFATASSGLECAIAIQRGVAAHKEEHPDSPLAIYVGINAGEPIAEDDDLFGTSVNLAARICDHAEAGQILAANVVRELTAGKQFLFSDLGETELRGFEDPVKLWELRWQDEG